jgi:cytidine deaminase
MPDGTPLDVSAEDAKLLVLARSAAARSGSSGAAVRDSMGRTYLAGPVSMAALALTAVQAAVAAAVSSGATSVEAVAVVGAAPTLTDLNVLAELGSPMVHSA